MMKFWRKFIKGIAEFFTGKELKSSVEKNSEQMEELKSKMALLLERVPEEEVSEVALPERELSLVNPFNHEEELLKIEGLNDEGVKAQRGYKRLEAAKGGELNALIQQVPNLFSAAALSNSYRVIMPAGKSGELMKLSNGLLSTVMKGADGKVVAHAGLKSMAAAASPLLIFTAMSAVTGQYFMAKINSNLEQIKKEIKDIKGILLDDKIAYTEAYFHFLEKATNNYQAISRNKQHADATLRNIQEVGYKLYGDIQFYHKQLERVKVKLEVKEKSSIDNIEEEVINAIDMFTYWAIAMKGYFWQQVLEIYYSKNYDDSYLKSVIVELGKRNKEYIEFKGELLKKVDKYLIEIKVKRDVGEHILGLCNKFTSHFNRNNNSSYHTMGEQRLLELREGKEEEQGKTESVSSTIKNRGEKAGMEMQGIIDTIENMRFRNSTPLELVVDADSEEIYVWEKEDRQRERVLVEC